MNVISNDKNSIQYVNSYTDCNNRISIFNNRL